MYSICLKARLLIYFFFFFFFKQKTAYEITHSDWSSDVCSSDLGPDLRRVLRGLQIDQRRPGALRPQRRHLGGARAPHLLPQPRLGRQGAARASQTRATPRFRRLRGVPRVPRGVPRGPGAESELVRSRRPVTDARYHLERVRFARGDRNGAAVWAARGDRVRAVEQRRTRQRRRDRPGSGRATPPSGPRRLARPGRSRGA